MATRSPLEHVLLFFGCIALIHTVCQLLVVLYRRILKAPASYRPFIGKWAVITGASAGIGAGFARRLAARGLNVVLLARSKDRLDAVAQECQTLGKAYPIQTRVISFDFGTATADDYARLGEELALLDIAVLVNNVGVNVPHPMKFLDIEDSVMENIVKVNVEATNKMTKMLLPAMVEKKRGAVFCLSSGGGVVAPAPLLSVYAGTKAYNDAFAIALAGETRNSNIAVHSLTPFFVETGMAKLRRSITVPTSDHFAENALCGLGGAVRANSYWPHAVIATAIRLFPLKTQIAYVSSVHADIQKRAIRKAQRLAAAGKSQ